MPGSGGAASGGTGGMGTGGMGTGGNCGLFGCAGSGGMGTGGMGTGGTGTGGMGTGGTGGVGTGGTGGAGTGGTGGGGPVECTTSALCQSCPSAPLCDDNDDCAPGLVCIDTGCDDTLGSPINKCVFAGGGACESSATCPAGRECLDVPGEGMRCVKTTPGCDTSADCVLGFACEGGACADRRVPCDPQDDQCPKNHLCVSDSSSSFCRRIQQSCESDVDCVDLAPHCEDIDGDLQKECAGSFNPNDPMSPACTNAQCSGGAPVCEAASFASTTQCGQYGLCLGDGDCAGGFTCVALWPDGRSECVPSGGSCSSFSDCPAQQVCASPRAGGAPSCQAGL